MARRLLSPYITLLDGNGNPAAGGTVTFYAPGTSTPKKVYTTRALVTEEANPKTADGAGRIKDVWLDGDYRVVVRDGGGSIVHDADPYIGFGDENGDLDLVRDFDCAGDGVTDDTAKVQQAITAAIDQGRNLTGHGNFKITSTINVAGTAGSGAFWRNIKIYGNASGLRFTSTHNGLLFNDQVGFVKFQGVGIYGPGAAFTSAVAMKGVMSRGGAEDFEIAGFYYAIDNSGGLDCTFRHGRITGCNQGYRNANAGGGVFSPGARLDNMYIDFCATGIYMREVYFAQIHAYVEYCTTGLDLDGCRISRVEAWLESNTTHYTVGAFNSFTQFTPHIAGAGTQTFGDGPNNGYSFNAGDGAYMSLVAGWENVAYGAAASRQIGYRGVSSIAADDGACKGILERNSKSAGSGAATHNEILWQWVRGYNTARFSIAGNLQNFIRWTLAGILPAITNTYDLGSGSFVWKDIYTQNAVTVVSDRRKKKGIRAIDAALLDAWEQVQPQFYQWSEGADCRRHAGIIAQDLDAALKQAGLEAEHYGLLAKDARGYLMVVPDECQWVEAAWQRREIAKLRRQLAGES